MVCSLLFHKSNVPNLEDINMKLVEIVQEVLTTGEMPMSLERKICKLLNTQEFSEPEIAAIDELLEALYSGSVRPVA